MENRHLFYPLILALSLVAACNKDDDTIHLSDTDYLVFGHFYGECLGESCIENYRLESNRILELTDDSYPNKSINYNGNYALLPDSIFTLVKDLPNYFPQKLIDEHDTIIGQPDAGDWGGIYIEYNRDGVQRFWLIDQMKSNVPEYLFDFIDKVNEKIALING